MKLNETKPYLESYGQLQEQSFAIEDQGMIFDILRNKMYSNPILAICREISCNARDAHREVGIAKTPIHIHLPNNLEPYFKIQDFGPGISPDRMSNVFIKYTASTKRSDNVQTGGFGLGAKTPFSYSDSFSIITIHNGIKYNYNCVIDETRVGKIILATQTPTKERNGTEIMIPVLPKNFLDFATYTERACRHWDVKPVINGGTIRWQENKIILEGDKWAIAASDGRDGTARMIIDGIEYPLDLSALRNYADTKLIDAAEGIFIMYFGVGELSLAASRESIFLDERTKGIIRDRLEAIRIALRSKAVEKIESFPDLWSANIYFNEDLREAFNNIAFLGALTWKNIPLTEHHFSVETPVFAFTKGKYSRKYGTDPDKLSRNQGNHVKFEENSVLYFNDLPIKEPTPRHIKKAFELDPTLKTAFIINGSDKITYDDLNKKLHLEQMGIKFLSTITKATARAYTPPAQRVLVFKFDSRAACFRQVSYASLDEDNSTKILCYLVRDSHTGVRTASLDKGDLNYSAIKKLMVKYPNHTFYGVDEDVSSDRIKKDFSDFIPADDFIKEKVIDNKSIDYLQIKFAISHRGSIDEKMLRVSEQMKTLVKDSNSLYFQRWAAHDKIREIAKLESDLLDIYEAANGPIDESQLRIFVNAHPHLDIARFNKLYNKKYPLLKHIQSWNYQDIVGELADYINLVDKENKNV